MKKVKDVFVLPVVPKGGIRVYVTALRDDADCVESEKLAAHAINHVDALAEALEAVLPYCQGRTKEQIDAWAAAKDALAAYRGEA